MKASTLGTLHVPVPLLQEKGESGRKHKTGQSIEVREPTPVSSIFTVPIVSLTPPADSEASSAPPSKKRRVKREELCREADVLRNFVSSHELPSVDKLFDELVQE